MPHDLPSAEQLVRAVRLLLEREIVPSAQGPLRYEIIIATRVLAIVERELEVGLAQSATHRDRLASLGFDSDAALASAIRAGSFDGRESELMNALAPVVLDKLRVANPKYLIT